MSIVDKVLAAVTPTETDEQRLEAKTQARASALPGSWLELVLDHHSEIESSFEAVHIANSEPARSQAHHRLALLLNGHSIAEEAVIYPALARVGEKGHAETAYQEQSTTKVDMAALEDLDPLGADYLEKLEHIRAAVRHHIYEEESDWFIQIVRQASMRAQQHLATRYEAEFNRYFSAPDDKGGEAAEALGMREAGGYSGLQDASQRGGLAPVGLEGGTYGGLRNEP